MSEIFEDISDHPKIPKEFFNAHVGQWYSTALEVQNHKGRPVSGIQVRFLAWAFNLTLI